MSGLHKAHETIWLQIDPDGESCDPEQWGVADDATWCQDQINSNDVKYIRADKVEDLEAKVIAQQERIDQLEKTIDNEMVVCHLGVFNSGDDPKKAIDTLMQWSQGVGEFFAKDKIATQQARIEQLKRAIGNWERSETPHEIQIAEAELINAGLGVTDDLSALKAHDAAIWREAMQIAEDSRNKATMGKYSSIPECRAARDMAECLSKAYCHKADAIEK